jgi:hypothetical protein
MIQLHKPTHLITSKPYFLHYNPVSVSRTISLYSPQLPLRPRFIGGGDLETLSLYRLLFGGTGLKDLLAPRRGGLGDREYEAGRPLRAGGGDRLAGLVLFGDRESYEGERLYCLALSRGPSLTDELLRRWEPGPAFPRGRPRGAGLPDCDLSRFLVGGGDRLCESYERLRASRAGGGGDRAPEA